MNNAEPLRLLIAEKSENDAEFLADILREAGHYIRYDYARDTETFDTALTTHLPDIVLSGSGKDVISSESIQDILAQRKLSPPVIAIVEEASEETVVAALRSGTSAVVSYGQPEHLQLAVSREITILQLQQKLAILEAAHVDCKDRCNTFSECSSEPGNSGLDGKPGNMAGIDSLTGLCNRQHFMSLLEHSIKSVDSSENVRALIYITLDGFKKIREENGIAASDAVLCDLARLLESQCNRQDTIARFGDYSYTILHHASSTGKIKTMGEELLHNISAHKLELNGQAISMTCSIGICAITGQAAEAQTILSHADTACEVARSSGGNGIHIHSAVIEEQVSGGHEEEGYDVIRKTIDEERFYLVYQPIISLAGDTSKRYEVLLRIVDEAGHTILPGQFLELAEKSGFCTEIDHWIFNTAFRKISELHEKGDDVTFYLKLTRSALADTNLPAWILGKLKEHKFPRSSVVFEVHELDALNDLKCAVTFIKAMQKMQCKVALEHFGVHSKTQLLEHVQADILKIDSSLIENLAYNKEQQSRVRSLIKLAHESGKVCIAERVDNPADLAILWQNGVDMVQGNFIQEPGREPEYDFQCEIA